MSGNSAAKRRHQRLASYGLRRQDYEALLNGQNGVCAVCSRGETKMQGGIVQPLSVDHDHETGRVRGLLCNGCNTALGLMREDPASIMRLALYAARA